MCLGKKGPPEEEFLGEKKGKKGKSSVRGSQWRFTN